MVIVDSGGLKWLSSANISPSHCSVAERFTMKDGVRMSRFAMIAMLRTI